LSNCDEEPIINRALDTDTSKRMYHSSFVWTCRSKEAAGNDKEALNGKVYFTEECCR